MGVYARFGVVAHVLGRRPLDDVLKIASETGYNGVEFFPETVREFFDRPQQFSALLHARGLRLTGLYYGRDFLDPKVKKDEIEGSLACARFLAEAGEKNLVLGPGRRLEAPLSCEQLKSMAGLLSEVGATVLGELGVTACFHPHYGTTVQEPDEIRTVLDAADPRTLFFNPDSGHIARAGGDPAAIVEEYLERVSYVHLKDLQGETFVELGRGTVDHDALFEVLRRGHYAGWMLAEVPIGKRSITPEESVRINLQFMRSHWR